MNYFKKLFSDKLLIYSCIFNLILCACMSYFYFDSGKMIEPLLYAIFFFLYIIAVLIFGRKCLPIMYLIFAAGATQDTIFINCTCFFILIGIYWCFPEWKYPIFLTYGIEIVIVCFRHNKTVFHLLAHFSFCVIFFFFAEVVKKIVIEKALRSVVIPDGRLELDPKEEIVIRQLAEGKRQKEIKEFSKNTIHRYIEIAMERNNCSTPEELVARYAIYNKSQEKLVSNPT